MTFTISWGWWLVPALLTLAAFIWYRVQVRSLPPSSGGYGMGAVTELVIALMAACPVLVAWLIWALLR